MSRLSSCSWDPDYSEEDVIFDLGGSEKQVSTVLPVDHAVMSTILSAASRTVEDSPCCTGWQTRNIAIGYDVGVGVVVSWGCALRPH